MICPVILCGGSGTRLWPLSRSHHPKQLLSLFSEKSLLQETLLRVADRTIFSPPILVCNNEYRFIIAEQAREVGIEPRAILLEPAGRNTTAPAALAAMLMQESTEPDVMLIMPSDHQVNDEYSFRKACLQASEVCHEKNVIVTLGIQPTQAHTGYGYIKAAEDTVALSGVDRFVEKPDKATAQSYLDEGGYYWNSGMFICRPDTLLEGVATHAADVFSACTSVFDRHYPDLDFLRFDEGLFAQIPKISLDYAVMEHAHNLMVLSVDMGWSDVGSWESLWSLSPKDDLGNAQHGDIILQDSANNYIHSEGTLVAVNGLSDIVVAATKDAVLVSDRSSVDAVGNIVARLADSGREEEAQSSRQYRPWGWFETVDIDIGFKVKRIVVNPGKKLSLQRHSKRAEHWVVVDGTARVVRDDETFELQANQSTYIAIGQKHRLENAGQSPLQMIEVQTGLYLEEDDIERFDDDFGR